MLLILGVAYALSIVCLPKKGVSSVERSIYCWYAFDGLTHLIVEASFVYLSIFGRTVATSSGPFAELWKEYGRADIRWLHAAPDVVALEILTVLGAGPLCLYMLYAMAKNRPDRHFWQIVLCTAELYGGWMTFCPEWLTGSKYLVTDDPLLLWVYLVFFNGLWVVIPIGLMIQSYVALTSTNSSQIKAKIARKEL
ncbi:hypothetical protein BZG36_04336 [Bifiguratus adelaidae]|uniref:EXPERA domain-containing protein n=1 Tax=Bifiguratus adelaidae TaxID=1938954 RepID=A0A261XW15_9FUNG|nr:hypothetical protein BZG36_04336 [Bifiguratus adelaidae]